MYLMSVGRIAAPLNSNDFFESRQFNESTDTVSDGDEGASGICYPIGN